MMTWAMRCLFLSVIVLGEIKIHFCYWAKFEENSWDEVARLQTEWQCIIRATGPIEPIMQA
jgi:hypothetical protein